MSLYALLIFVIILAVLVMVWKYIAPVVGEPWGKIGWVIIGAFAVLWLARMLLLGGGTGPMLVY